MGNFRVLMAPIYEYFHAVECGLKAHGIAIGVSLGVDLPLDVTLGSMDDAVNG